jgi:hypothetical protein
MAIGLTRDQLAKFLEDHEAIKAFEALFKQVNSVTTIVVDNSEASIASAQALAQEAAQSAASLKDMVELAVLRPPEVPAKPARYGSFFSSVTQNAAVINTAYAMTYNNTDISSGVRLRSPSTSEVEIDTEGVYNIQFSAQLDNTSGGNHLAFIWLRVNGVDVANTASQVRLKSSDGELIAAWNFFYNFKARDYFELMWSANDVAVQLTAIAAAAPVPAIPSVILTVDRVNN